MHRPRRFARVLAPSLLPLLSLSLCLAASPAAAAAPEVKFPVTFTTTLTPGTVYPFTFSIWDMKTGGTQVADWVEGPVKLAVASNKTVYFVLGSKVALPALDFSQQYWVQIATGLKKYRTRLPAAGYSFWSQSVDTTALDARYVEEGQAGTVTETMIADGQVTAPKVASGAADAGTVLTADGSGGARWQALSDVPPAAHQHAGEDVASGTVGAARVDAAIARDSEIVPAVLAADGTGSTLDADLLDGKHGSSYVSLPYAGSGGTSGALFSVTNELDNAFTEPIAVKGIASDNGDCGWFDCDSTGGWFEGTTGVYAKGGILGWAGRFDGRLSVTGGTSLVGTTITGNLSMDSGGVATSGKIDFGAKTRQMLNLWNAEYGVGVQTNTTYARTNSDFAVFRGGSHSDAYLDPGAGGALLMNVNSTGIGIAGSGAWKPGGGTWIDSSDSRLKKNVRPLAGALERLLRLRGVEYEWIEPRHAALFPGYQTGMIAQEVEQVFPEWVGVGADGFKTLGFRGFEALTVEALRDLQLRVDGADAALRARMDAQETALTAQADEIAALRAQLAAQSLLVERLLAATGRGGESTATR